jgi:serine kinase of HPr protein (carbohydrate metabolism regulator)
MSATIHASAVLTGARAVLIRGPSGSGKSSLAYALVCAAQSGALAFARLIGDDRVHLETAHGCLLVRPAEALTGLIEIRGAGIRRLPYEAVARVGLVVDLAAADGTRLPPAESAVTDVAGVRLPRLAVAPGVDPFPPLYAALRTEDSGA